MSNTTVEELHTGLREWASYQGRSAQAGIELLIKSGYASDPAAPWFERRTHFTDLNLDALYIGTRNLPAHQRALLDIAASLIGGGPIERKSGQVVRERLGAQFEKLHHNDMHLVLAAIAATAGFAGSTEVSWEDQVHHVPAVFAWPEDYDALPQGVSR